MLGADLVLPKDIAKRYQRSSEGIKGDAPADLATLLNAFNQAQDVMVAGLLFHEAYHCGQIGVLRRVTGHECAIK